MEKRNITQNKEVLELLLLCIAHLQVTRYLQTELEIDKTERLEKNKKV